MSSEAPTILVATAMRRHGPTGVQRHVQALSEYAESTGQPLSVVTPFDSRAPSLTAVFAARMVIQPFSTTASVWWYRRWHQHYLAHALREHLHRMQAEVVLAQGPVEVAAALQARTCEPIVLTVHFNRSQADEWAGKNQIRPRGRLYQQIRAFESDIIPRVDGIIYVSESSRAATEELVPEARRVRSIVIPNPVPSRRATEQPAPMADLITVGGLEPRKNHTYLLTVLQEASRRGFDYTLTLVGDGPERRRLSRQAELSGLADQVSFLGYQHDARALMSAHRLYCHTATEESFGMVVAEAMAEGLPVLSGEVGGIPEVMRAGQDGLFWPLDDPATAAAMLIDLMEDGYRQSMMAENGRARARRRYSAEVTSDAIIHFANDIRNAQVGTAE